LNRTNFDLVHLSFESVFVAHAHKTSNLWPHHLLISSAMAPTGDGFDGDGFTNNLLSDLAPLLALFGGQVIKQFLSMSLGLADHILLAMGPIGVVTIVVSAIRIGGSKSLKALVGRQVKVPILEVQ
jgi:hypothetical protein